MARNINWEEFLRDFFASQLASEVSHTEGGIGALSSLFPVSPLFCRGLDPFSTPSLHRQSMKDGDKEQGGRCPSTNPKIAPTGKRLGFIITTPTPCLAGGNAGWLEPASQGRQAPFRPSQQIYPSTAKPSNWSKLNFSGGACPD